jgi:hypothetical protein
MTVPRLTQIDCPVPLATLSARADWVGSGYGGLTVTGGLMAEETLLDKVHDLSDLELAALICLIAQEHCMIDTEPDVLDDLVQELELVRFDWKYHNALLLTLFR